MKTKLAVFIAATLLINIASAATPSNEEMWKIIQEQQKLIDKLQTQLENNNEKVAEVSETVEEAVEAVEVAQKSSGSGWFDKTQIGGYGELHYNSQDGNDQVDFHRYVLYVGHEFTDSVRFFSEFELEHSLAGEGKPGEVELEQAWVEIDLSESHRLRAGLDILPIGILNPTHEPDTFYGVERNRVESQIIPATWWEAGIGFNGELAPGWSYDARVHSGLAVPANGAIRSGRQKVAEANADHPAFTAQLKYTGIPGLEVASSLQYQGDIQAGTGATANEATLFEAHVDWRHSSGFGLRALYAGWDLDNEIRAGTGDDDQYGFYIEPSYRFPVSFMPGEMGIFARWNEIDRANDREEEEIRLGMNYWPAERVVFKFDYADIQDTDANTSSNSMNLGVGVSF